ncbi:unnamed protein product (macronuclear) [Paramecium tetraurelia]|uniref:Uncharacterized protein n=1 Tax=Paramecium tetraurelia TaxID=5888 RepID=A0E548_PARTE|nr:uncharacterized protein GSPATT00023592001 [Paramecium tetraurelia]CAK90415.1 unnamed protein product [Paramecium tetraurelia]|eukprot:XP_001457812.1 hypothetical protein (macronuclear) [Paramecium tetraurelia strain d4-2]
MQGYTIKQLLLDIAEVIDNDIIDTYEQINKVSVKQISEQSEKQQYDNILQIVAYLNRVKTVFEEQLEEHINNDYETIIQKLEASIRTHIRIEQQQKLQIDALIQKIDEVSAEKDIIIIQQQEKIKSLEQAIKDQHKKIFDSSPKEILHKKTPSAFERLSKLVSNKSQKSLQNSNNEANFKALLKICNTEKDRSLSKGRKQVTVKQESGNQRTNDETQAQTDRNRKTKRFKSQLSNHNNRQVQRNCISIIKRKKNRHQLDKNKQWAAKVLIKLVKAYKHCRDRFQTLACKIIKVHNYSNSCRRNDFIYKTVIRPFSNYLQFSFGLNFFSIYLYLLSSTGTKFSSLNSILFAKFNNSIIFCLINT